MSRDSQSVAVVIGSRWRTLAHNQVLGSIPHQHIDNAGAISGAFIGALLYSSCSWLKLLPSAFSAASACFWRLPAVSLVRSSLRGLLASDSFSDWHAWCHVCVTGIVDSPRTFLMVEHQVLASQKDNPCLYQCPLSAGLQLQSKEIAIAGSPMHVHAHMWPFERGTHKSSR